MNKKIGLTLLFCFVCLFVMSCERYPITDLNNIPGAVSSWPYPWYIYDDELNTKGLFEPVMFDDDSHTGDYHPDQLSFDCKDGVYRGRNCIVFEWHPKNGKTWCGFGLATTEEPFNDKVSKDMSTSGYTKLEFYIKGNITSGAVVTVSIPRNNYEGTAMSPTDSFATTTVSNNWEKKTIYLTNAKTKVNWNTQKYYISISISGENSNGAKIYLDDIRFVKD